MYKGTNIRLSLYNFWNDDSDVNAMKSLHFL